MEKRRKEPKTKGQRKTESRSRKTRGQCFGLEPPRPTAVEQQGQEAAGEAADVEEHGWTLDGPEAQGHVLSPGQDVRRDGARDQAAVPAEIQTFPDAVAHRRPRPKAGRHLWTHGRSKVNGLNLRWDGVGLPWVALGYLTDRRPRSAPRGRSRSGNQRGAPRSGRGSGTRRRSCCSGRGSRAGPLA